MRRDVPRFGVLLALAAFLIILFSMRSFSAAQPQIFSISGCPSCGALPPQPYFISQAALAQTTYPFYEYGGNGALVPTAASPIPPSQTMPVVHSVQSYNNNNAAWLLTCPRTPNPADTLDYIASGDTNFIAGNECTVNTTPLNTVVSSIITVDWSSTEWAHATLSVNGSRIASLVANDIAYSGEAYNSTSGLGSANVSNGYDTSTNIFSGVPATGQSGIWGWSAKIGNLSQIDPSKLDQGQSTGLIYNVTTPSGVCTYSYDFVTNAIISSIHNDNSIIVQSPSLASTNYLSFNNATYTGLTVLNPGTADAPNTILMSACDVPNFWTSLDLVGTGGVADVNGKMQYGLCVYTQGGTPYYWTSVNNGGVASPVRVSAYQPSFASSPVVPYLLYNVSLPISAETASSGGVSFLNYSYDIYSGHNVQSPGNFLDPFLLGGNADGSSLFMNVNSLLVQLSAPEFFGGTSVPAHQALQVQSGRFIVQQNATVANTLYGLPSPQAIGKSYSVSTIPKPMLLSEAPGIFYAMSNEPTKSNSGGVSAYYYLYGLRYYPAGYFSAPARQPLNVSVGYQGTSTAYSSMLQSYLSNMSVLQSGGYYVTKMYNITKLWESGLSTLPGGQSYYSSNPTPIAMASDGSGDSFILAPNSTCTALNAFTCKGFDLLYISANGTVMTQNVTSEPNPTTSGFQLGVLINAYPSQTSLAVSPNGEYLYVSVPAEPYVMIYRTVISNTLNATYATAINLSYSTTTQNFSITRYLENGGPYNSSALKSYYSGSTLNTNDTLNDQGSGYSYHEPLALADSGGILYVLDNWFFGVVTPKSNNPASQNYNNMLMLRAFSYTGQEIPISSNPQYDMIPKGGFNLATGYSTNQTYPPYGIPLAANFSFNYGYVSYCAYGCLYSPANILQPQPVSATFSTDSRTTGSRTDTSWLSSEFPIIGPFGGAEKQQFSAQTGVPPATEVPGPISFYADFNNTIYLNALTYATTTAPGACTISQPGPGNPCYLYNELAGIHFNPENYTRLAVQPQISYACYLGLNPSVTQPGPTTCQVVDNLSRQLPPSLGIPDSFTYAENLGSPSAYLLGPVLSSTLFSGGGGGSGGSPSSGSTNVIVGNSTSITLPPILSGLPASKLRSRISGYILVPFSYTYSLTQSYSNVQTPPGCPPVTPPNPSTQSGTVYTAQPVYANSWLNETLQSGFVVGQYQNNNGYYQANLSDAGLIIPPQIALNIFSNRIFGQIYVNQSVSPTGMIYPPGAPSAGGPSTWTSTFQFDHNTMSMALTAQHNPGIYGIADMLTVALSPLFSNGPDEVTLTVNSLATGSTVLQETRGWSSASGATLYFNFPLCSGVSTTCLPAGTYTVSTCAFWSGNPAVKYCGGPFSSLKIISVEPVSLVINATHLYNYSQVDYQQYYCSRAACGGLIHLRSAPGFSAEASLQSVPQTIGASCAFCVKPYYYNKANLFTMNNTFSHTVQRMPNLLLLFSQLKAITYNDNLLLGMLYNANVLGYNRLNYTYIDQFNNTINMPLDADLANITSISMNITTVINASNPNSTLVKVQGVAGYYPNIFSTAPLPAPEGSQVYLYYDTNINFYNATSGPSYNPDAYYKYAQICAFGYGGICSYANPSLTTPPPIGQGSAGTIEAQVVTFHTQYNSSGECSPEPNSLLVGQNTVQCNIYGLYGLPTSGTSAYGGERKYCIPYYTNGTGVLTTQLGLASVASVNGTGAFNYTFRACGTGTGRIQASYYGYPANQPQVFYQPALQSSTPNLLVASPEFNYTTAPNSTFKSFQLGTYYLSFGDIASMAGILGVAVLLCYMLLRRESTP